MSGLRLTCLLVLLKLEVLRRWAAFLNSVHLFIKQLSSKGHYQLICNNILSTCCINIISTCCINIISTIRRTS